MGKSLDGYGCGKWLCVFCESEVPDESAECCGEMGRTIQCGESDEGQCSLCPDCHDSRDEYWRGYFGIRPGMSAAERRAQLKAVNPTPTTLEELEAFRRMK